MVLVIYLNISFFFKIVTIKQTKWFYGKKMENPVMSNKKNKKPIYCSHLEEFTSKNQAYIFPGCDIQTQKHTRSDVVLYMCISLYNTYKSIYLSIISFYIYIYQGALPPTSNASQPVQSFKTGIFFFSFKNNYQIVEDCHEQR